MRISRRDALCYFRQPPHAFALFGPTSMNPPMSLLISRGVLLAHASRTRWRSREEQGTLSISSLGLEWYVVYRTRAELVHASCMSMHRQQITIAMTSCPPLSVSFHSGFKFNVRYAGSSPPKLRYARVRKRSLRASY